jgi:redox-sensitive bicupin YhaK (pirin superfamily)
MMITLRPAQERGQAHFDWLDSQHSFSFGQYFDLNHQGFATLRVINEDKIQPAQGFGTHGHRDMEIVTYVLDGALEHKDSIGNGSIMRPGDVQRMTAGTGILHSEFNASPSESVHLLQIWILPNQSGLPPSYEQTYFPQASKQGKLCLIGSVDGREGSVTIHQAVDLYATILDAGETVSHALSQGHQAWIQLARGSVTLGDRILTAGDGAALTHESSLTLAGVSDQSEVLVFDFGN